MEKSPKPQQPLQPWHIILALLVLAGSVAMWGFWPTIGQMISCVFDECQ